VTDRWRGRSSVLAIALAGLLLAVVAGAAMAGPSGTVLQVGLPGGVAVADVDLPATGAFTLRYRNSLYGTLAEERFTVMPDGSVRLVELAAEQLAVLEEYYAIDVPAQRSRTGWWTADPAHVPDIRTLTVAATDRGQRTLLVEGQPPLDLWRLVDDGAPSVTLAASDR
jgi:hypothetical protein